MEYRGVKRILLISLSCIGDVLLTTPVMKVLKDNFPTAALDVVAGPTSMPIIERHELIDYSITYENKGRHKGVPGAALLVWELRKKKYDLVVDLRNTAIPYFIRSSHKITAHRSHLKNRDAGGRHAIDRHLDVLELAGLPITCRQMIVTVPDDVNRKVTEYLQKNDLEDRVLIGIYPGAGSEYKKYPAKKFVEAMEKTAEHTDDAVYVLVGSAADAGTCAEIASAFSGNAVSAAGKLDILELGALLKRCAMMISNDSGPMHLAAALGTPTVAVFGPTDAERYGPRGGIHKIVWHREDCNPCKYPVCGKPSCINKVSAEQVADAAIELWNIRRASKSTAR